MAEPTVENIFGTGAQRLTSTTPAPSDGLFIPDSALTAAGLDTPSSATAEQHFVAIIVNARGNLTLTAFDGDTDRSIYIEDGFATFTNRGENSDRYQVDPVTVNLAKQNLVTALDPDDY